MHWLLSCEVLFFFVYCVIKRIVDHAPVQTLPLCKTASAIVATESEISKKFTLTVFSKSFVLRTKVPFNKSEVITL